MIEEHIFTPDPGGLILVDSLATGTCFTVLLPLEPPGLGATP